MVELNLNISIITSKVSGLSILIKTTEIVRQGREARSPNMLSTRHTLYLFLNFIEV